MTILKKYFHLCPTLFHTLILFYEEDNEYFLWNDNRWGNLICWNQDEYIEDIELITSAQSTQETPSIPNFDILSFDYSNNSLILDLDYDSTSHIYCVDQFEDEIDRDYDGDFFEDCDDNDINIGFHTNDFDCDGIPSNEDCDDLRWFG